MKVIAIDPGVSGGVAILTDINIVTAYKMPAEMNHMYQLFKNNPSCPVVLEDVGFHIKGNSASSSVKFGAHVERLKTYIEITENPLVLVKARKWQAPLNLTHGMGAKDKRDRKAQIKDLMAEKYPHIGRITNYTADAIAILDWYINRNPVEIFLENEGKK